MRGMYPEHQVVVKVYYHLSIVGWKIGKTLCGARVKDVLLWDYPNIFFGERVPSNAERCPECMDHPDYPLLVLAEVGE